MLSPPFLCSPSCSDRSTKTDYSAACALISAETWRMARASCSAGCAPETAYFCANTKVGTPEMPLSEASCASGAAPPPRLHQHVHVGQVPAVPEIQFHQPLFHLRGLAFCFRPVDQ